MKKLSKNMLAMLFLLPLSYQNTYPHGQWHNFIRKACATITGSWYCIESDDALIARVETEYLALYSHYRPIIEHFLISQTGLIAKYGQPREQIFIDIQKVNNISESLLHDFALYTESRNQSLFNYHTHIGLAQEKLSRCREDLVNRIHIRTAQHTSYEQQKNALMIRTLFKDISLLSHYITILNQCFETHKGYFYLHETMKDLCNRYSLYVTLLESAPDQMIEDVKNRTYNGAKIEYSLIKFVKNLVIDIDTLRKDSAKLPNHSIYDTAHKDAAHLLDQLIDIKNNLVSNDIYWQELVKYQIESEKRIKELERRIKELEQKLYAARTVVYHQPVYYHVPAQNTAWTKAN